MLKSYWKMLLLFVSMFVVMLVSSSSIYADNGYVKDDANVLSAKTEQKIADLNTRKLQKLKQDPQLVVMTVKSLNGESVTQAADAAFEKYHFGNSTYNNGVLIFVAINDHKVRVATGSGLDSKMPNGDIDEILTDDVKSQMQDNDYDAGILAMAQNATKQLRLLYDSGYIQSVKKENEQIVRVGNLIALITFIMVFGISVIFIGVWIRNLRIRKKNALILQKRFETFKTEHIPEMCKLWGKTQAEVESRINELWTAQDFEGKSNGLPTNYYRSVNIYSYADATKQSFSAADYQLISLFNVSQVLSHDSNTNKHFIGNTVLNSQKFDLQKFLKDVTYWKDAQQTSDNNFKKYIDGLDPNVVAKRLNKKEGIKLSAKEVSSQLNEFRSSTLLQRSNYHNAGVDYPTNNSMFDVLLFAMLVDNNTPSHSSFDSDSSFGFGSNSYNNSDFGGGGGGFDGGGGSGSW